MKPIGLEPRTAPFRQSERKAQRRSREAGEAAKWARLDSNHPANQGFSSFEGTTGGTTARSREHLGVVDFGIVDHHVRVRVGGDGQLLLTDEPPDFGPRAALTVQQRDSAVSQIMR